MAAGQVPPGYAIKAVREIREAMARQGDMRRCRYCKRRYLPPMGPQGPKPTTSCGLVTCRMADADGR